MIQLSDHFTIRRLLQFTAPSIIMMVFTSIYSVVDGFFVSNFAGKTQFAAVNLIMPVLMILGAPGFMFGTGGSALIAQLFGKQKQKQANELFTMLVTCAAAVGVLLMALGMAFLPALARVLGATGELLQSSVLYGRIVLAALPFYLLQYVFQCLFATAQKPKLGLYVTVLSGVSNMVLDAVFVGVLGWGLAGAAAATAVSQLVGGALPLFYFAKPRQGSLLVFTRFSFDLRALAKTCGNGSSELMSNISMSLVSMLYNAQLMRWAGEDGVSAYGVLMYVSMIFQAIFIGYCVGSSPIVSYHYGARNHRELQGLRKKSLRILLAAALAMFAAGELAARPLATVFVGYDAALLEMTAHAFAIFSFSFLLSGFSIFGSSFFTALGDGLTSALISFLRTLVFQIAAVLIFPLLWALDGIWLSIVAAEVMSLAVTALFLFTKRRRYGY